MLEEKLMNCYRYIKPIQKMLTVLKGEKKPSFTVALLISEYMLTVMLCSVDVSHKPLHREL